jgi:photoactive yellow protein
MPEFADISDIATAQLLTRVESLSHEALDVLPFGVIQLDSAGRVVFFSRTEARQSGFGERNALGRSFFREIAPCMNNPAFMQRLEQARAAGTLDITFEQVGDFDDAQRELRVRVISASAGGVWLFIQRP